MFPQLLNAPLAGLASFGWQDLAALALVAASLGYVAVLGWRVVFRRAATGCGGGGCKSCPAGSANEGSPSTGPSSPAGFVPLGDLQVLSRSRDPFSRGPGAA